MQFYSNFPQIAKNIFELTASPIKSSDIYSLRNIKKHLNSLNSSAPHLDSDIFKPFIEERDSMNRLRGNVFL